MSWRGVLMLFWCGVLHVQTLHAQDDVPWWRQLFGTSEVDSASVAIPDSEGGALPLQSEPVDVEQELLMEVPASVETLRSEVGFLVPAEGSGSLSLDVPESIEALDSLRPEPEDVRIPGFRIQLFMGKLDSARSLRNHLLTEEGLDYDVHLAPYPPAFGVQVGDFRTFLSAHRAKRSLLGGFPDALVVPAELTVEEAFPSSSDCIRTP